MTEAPKFPLQKTAPALMQAALAAADPGEPKKTPFGLGVLGLERLPHKIVESRLTCITGSNMLVVSHLCRRAMFMI